MALTDTPQEPAKSPDSVLKKILPFTTVAMIIAALYVAYTFYSRHQSDVEAQQAAAAKQREQQQRTVKTVFGSGEILFNNFSADAGVLKAGAHTQLCYGVENATQVVLDPPVAPVKPAYRNCIEIAPKTTTTYKITASDAAGHSKSQSLTVRVE